MQFPKSKKIRDKKWLEEVRKMSCVVTGRMPVEVAHIRWGSHAGMSQKPDDFYVMPLCPAEHRKQHSMSEVKYWRDVVALDDTLLMQMVRAYCEIQYMRWKDGK